MRLSQRKVLGFGMRDVLSVLGMLFLAITVSGGIAPPEYVTSACFGALLATVAGIALGLRGILFPHLPQSRRVVLHVAALNAALLVALVAGRVSRGAAGRDDPFAESAPKLNAAQNAIPPLGVTAFDPRPLTDALSPHVQLNRFRFVVLGNGRNASKFASLCEWIDKELKPDLVLTCGDMVLQGAGSLGPACWEKLAQDAGKHMRQCPWWPAVGDNELRGGAVLPVDRAQEFYSQPENPFGGLEAFQAFYGIDSDHYSFYFRNAAFIVLPPKPLEGETEAWLAIEMYKASSEGKHIFVLNHFPFFSISSQGRGSQQTGALSLFNLYSVRAVFSAHDRVYYRTLREGVPYIVCGGAGPAPERGDYIRNALPEDVYYIRSKFAMERADPDGRNFVLHNGAGRRGDRFMEQPQPFVIVVDVDGASVKMRAASPAGATLDELRTGTQ